MIFILAGIDGSGKTTCADRLKRLMPDALFVKESDGKNLDDDGKLFRLQKAIKLSQSGRTVIYDRATILDDVVYEKALKNKESGILPDICSSNIFRNVEVIYFDVDIDVAFKRISERGDEFVNKIEQLSLIKSEYERAFAKLSVIPFRVYAEEMNSFEVANVVSRWIERKSPKIAEIVPLGSLPDIDNNQYHMCLSHLVKESDEYAKFYNLQSLKGNYVLMDNGAAENSQLSNEELVECYSKVNPTEIVIPDTLLDGIDTVRKANEFMRQYGDLPYKFMAVPQGKTTFEWMVCAEQFLKDRRINSIGISKFLGMELNDNKARFEAVEFIDELARHMGRNIEIHLLGCSEGPLEMMRIMNRFRIVRGCDSAFAYLCAQAGVKVTSETTRPAGEIDFLNGKHYDSLTDCMDRFELVAGVNHNGYDITWRY